MFLPSIFLLTIPVLYASRVCLLLPRDQGIWSDPDLSQCLNSEESHFQSLVRLRDNLLQLQ